MPIQGSRALRWGLGAVAWPWLILLIPLVSVNCQGGETTPAAQTLGTFGFVPNTALQKVFGNVDTTLVGVVFFDVSTTPRARVNAVLSGPAFQSPTSQAAAKQSETTDDNGGLSMTWGVSTFGIYELSGDVNGTAFAKASLVVHSSSTGEKTAVKITPRVSSTGTPAVANGLVVDDIRCGFYQMLFTGTDILVDNGKYFWRGLRATVTNNGGTAKGVTARVLFLASDKVKIASFDRDLGTLVPGKSIGIDGAFYTSLVDDVSFCNLELWANGKKIRFSTDTPLPIPVANRDKPR